MGNIGLLLALLIAAVAGCGDEPFQPPPRDLPVAADRGAREASPADSSSDLADAVANKDANKDATLCGGKSCDDKLACTEDLCVASGCLNTIKPGNCVVDGVCYLQGALAVKGMCKRCDPKKTNKAWTSDVSLCVDDGLTCTGSQCTAGKCSDGLLTGWCLIGGVCVKDGAGDPKNDCQRCDVAVSTTSYQKKADGSACADDSLKCTADTCSGGKCVHTLKTGNCMIKGNCYLDKELNAMQDCQVCSVSKSNSSWSLRPDGSKCTDDGLFCTDEACKAGTCANTVKAGYCLINNTCYAAKQVNPISECQSCQPTIASTAWSNRTDGTGCTADALSCTTDACKAGACGHELKPGHCLIGGACYKHGDKQPSKSCLGCNTSASTGTWSVLQDGAPCGADLYSCTDDVCKSGACIHKLKTDQCLISGTCYKKDQAHPAVECLACRPGASASAWSPSTDGSSCKADAYSCTDDVCKSGACIHKLKTDQCLISGACYAKGAAHPSVECLTCTPAYSTGSWSKATDGTKCKDDGHSCTKDACSQGACAHAVKTGQCLIQGKCHPSGTVNPLDNCTACEPTKGTGTWSPRPAGTSCMSDNLACTKDACDGLGKCAHVLVSGQCVINSKCYQSGTPAPANDCQLCDPAKATTTWSPLPDLSACPGGRCASGSCCSGCITGSVCHAGSGDTTCGLTGQTCQNCSSSSQSCLFGNCFSRGCISRPGPGCAGCDCEACVCALDPYCCTFNWDSKCVTKCKDQCKAKCP